MEPTLRDGDWLLVDPEAFREHAPVAHDLVLVPDPREPARVLVKRVAGLGPDGRLNVFGDSPGRSTDTLDFGPVDAANVVGRPWFRYLPLRGFGRVK